MGIWEDYCIGRLADLIDIQRNTVYEMGNRAEPGNLIPRIDNSKTPNDFGFNKKSFSIIFPENELKKLSEKNIEKEISEINSSIAVSRLKDMETIELLVIPDADDKNEKDSIATEIRKFGQETAKKSDALHKSKASITGDSGRNQEYLGAKILTASTEYTRHSDAYRMFMDAYLYGSGQEGTNSQEMSEWNNGKKDRSIPSDEIITYKEKTEYIQAIMMNALMHAPMNHADPRVKDRYEAWKMSSKFYQQLSFFLCDNVLSPN